MIINKYFEYFYFFTVILLLTVDPNKNNINHIPAAIFQLKVQLKHLHISQNMKMTEYYSYL